MSVPEPTVFVVDDDDAVREFLGNLIQSVKLRVETFASARVFLDAYDPDRTGCLVLDIRMPGMSGLELQKELAKLASGLPVIILTGHGNVELAVGAMKVGAFDFVEKPFNNELLLDRIQKAVVQSERDKGERIKRIEIAERIEALTPREQEVLDLLIIGQTNKGIARRLEISEKTVEIHRTNLMRKMQAKSFAELITMAIDRQRT